jgi:hypothetical protein
MSASLAVLDEKILAGSPGVKYRIVKMMKPVAKRVTIIHRQRCKMYFAIQELPLLQGVPATVIQGLLQKPRWQLNVQILLKTVQYRSFSRTSDDCHDTRRLT